MKLTSSRLEVEIDEPGACYRGTRFDWTGFVTQVTLDSAVTFCVPEAMDGTGTGGNGLSNEFGIFSPVGHVEAAVGDWFPKLGVGLLRKPHPDPYSFAGSFELQPYPMRSEQKSPCRIDMVVDPLECRGYAARLHKIFTAKGCTLQIDYRLENVGEKPIRTNEYCHNFLCINGHPIGPDYAVCLPFAAKSAEWEPPLRPVGNGIELTEAPSTAFYRRLDFEQATGGGWGWELTCRPEKAKVLEQTNQPWINLAVWGTGRVMSVEAFVDISLAPGQTMTWQRLFTFSREE